MKSIKKILSCLIVLALCIGILPMGTLAQNETLSVAFIGSTTHKNPQITTYANRVFNYLTKEYPSYDMDLYLGDPLKLENDNFLDDVDFQVAQYNPDVVFIELNISTRYKLSAEELTSRTEAVVKQLSSNGKTPTIYFIYTPENTMLDLREPFDKVANHYGIRVCDVFSDLKAQYEKGEFRFIDFLTAGVVPSEAAHEHYERSIINWLRRFKDFVSPIKSVSSLTDTSKYKVSEPEIVIPETPTDNEVSLTLYVSLSGSDKNTGAIDSPIKSLDEARSRIRVAKNNLGDKFKGANVYIREGIYSLPNGFVLNKEDSGSKNAPITYSAYENEKVQFTTGTVLDYRDFELVTDVNTLMKLPVSSAGKVYRYDLQGHGLHVGKNLFVHDPGERTDAVSAASYTAVKLASIFLVDGRHQEYASWPNGANDGALVKISEKNAGRNSFNTMYYDEIISERWEDAEYAWMYGRIHNGYAHEYYPIDYIDTENKVIKTMYAGPHFFRPGYEWGIVNMIQELDIPGEHYIDDRYLYYYPMKPLSQSEIIYSATYTPLVQLNNTEFITFRGIDFSGAAGAGMEINDCFDTLVDNCKFENLGRWGVAILNTTGKATSGRNGIVNSDFRRTAAGGVKIYGGDDYNLTPSEDYVYNCLFEDYSTYAPVGSAAVAMDGDGTVGTPIGTKVWNNTIHCDNSSAIFIGGIKDDLRYNELYNVVKNVDDFGVIYGASQGAWRQGAIVEHNYLHDVRGKTSLTGGYGSVVGYYSDSLRNQGNVVDKNVFVNVQWPIWFSNNHNMTARGNLLLDNTGGGIGSTYTGGITEGAREQYDEMIIKLTEEGKIAPGQLKGPELLNETLVNRAWVSYVNTGRVTDENKNNYFLEFPWIENWMQTGMYVGKYIHIENNASFNHANPNVIQLHPDGLDSDTVINNYLSPDKITVDTEKGETEFDRIDKAMKIAEETIDGFEAWDIRKAGIQRPTIELGNFETKSPYNNQTGVEAKSQFFSWFNCDGADTYLIEIATDSEFKNIVYSETTNWNYIEVKDVLSYGGKRYYWRVFATPLSQQFTGERYNINGVQTFTTAISQYVEKSELINAIDFANDQLKTLIEGDDFGQVPAGTRKKLEEAIVKAQKVFDNSRVNITEVEEATNAVKIEAYKAIALAKFEEVDGYELFKDKNKFYYRAQTDGNAPELGTTLPAVNCIPGATTLTGTGSIVTESHVENNKVYRFTINSTYTNDGFRYNVLTLRLDNQNTYSYNSPTYALLMLDGSVELHSFNPPSNEGGFFEGKTLPEFKQGVDHDIEVAVINGKDGVTARFIVRIDGKVIFNKIHDVAPHLDRGFLGFFNDTPGVTTTIKKAKTNAPYPSLLELINDPESEIYKQQ